jgi:hypothetical protein
VAEPALTARPDSAAFLEDLEEKAASAASAVGGFEDFDFEVAGLGVRLRFAGPALREVFVPALEHLERPTAERPDLVVRVWDSETTGTTMVPPPWDLEDFRQHGVIRGLFGDGLYAVFGWAGLLSVVDARRGDAWFWARAPADLPALERAAPLRTALRLGLLHQEVLLVHGGAVGDSRGCLLLAGPSGVGKSSAALVAAGSGLGYLADDCCLVAPGEPLRVHSLYRSAKVDPPTLRRMPELAPLVDGPVPEDGKAMVLVPLERMLGTAELRGVVIPRLTGETETRTRPASAAAGLSALAPSSLLQFPGADAGMLRRMGDIVRAVPSHHLEVGSRAGSTAAALDALLESP